MRKGLMFALVMAGLLFANQARAHKIATHSDTRAKTVVGGGGGLKLISIAVASDSSVPCTASLYDSGALKAVIVVNAEDSFGPQRLGQGVRFSTCLEIDFDDTENMFATVLYETGAYGAYLHYVGDTTVQDTAYASHGDIVGLLASNWGYETHPFHVYDGTTERLRYYVPAFKTRYYNVDRFHFTTSFLITCDTTVMGVTVIRRD